MLLSVYVCHFILIINWYIHRCTHKHSHTKILIYITIKTYIFFQLRTGSFKVFVFPFICSFIHTFILLIFGIFIYKDSSAFTCVTVLVSIFSPLFLFNFIIHFVFSRMYFSQKGFACFISFFAFFLLLLLSPTLVIP